MVSSWTSLAVPLVIKSLCFHCRGHGFAPWLRSYDPTCCVMRQKKKKSKFFKRLLQGVNGHNAQNTPTSELGMWSSVIRTSEIMGLILCTQQMLSQGLPLLWLLLSGQNHQVDLLKHRLLGLSPSFSFNLAWDLKISFIKKEVSSHILSSYPLIFSSCH